MSTHRAWMRLPSGLHLDLINPHPDSWRDGDLSSRLSRTYRWGGESTWEFPLSVAQHSLSVLALRQLWAAGQGRALAPGLQLYELLHDAEEGFLGFDCISPLKAVLGQPFKNVSDNLMAAIRQRYRLPVPGADDYRLHKEADISIAASEAIHCIGWTETEVRQDLGIQHAILTHDPLQAIYGGQPWEPWPAALACQRFGEALAGLLGQVDG